MTEEKQDADVALSRSELPPDEKKKKNSSMVDILTMLVVSLAVSAALLYQARSLRNPQWNTPGFRTSGVPF